MRLVDIPGERYVDPTWLEELRQVDPFAELVWVTGDSWLLGTVYPRWLQPDGGLERRIRGDRLLRGIRESKLRLRKSWVMAECYRQGFVVFRQFNWVGEPPIGKLRREFAQADYLWRMSRGDPEFLKQLERGDHDAVTNSLDTPAMMDRVAYEGRAAYDFYLRKNRKFLVQGTKETGV